MNLTIPHEYFAGQRWGVNRDGVASEPGGPQGFDLFVGDLTIHFEDERDVVQMAKAILLRMGEPS